MTFISYAQNSEDVILWRALKHVENGFYIDVGACDPTELSVTRAFYERGWSGINIEPSKEYFDRCVTERPRDINLNVVAGARSGMQRFLNIAGSGLSTTVEAVAAQAEARGWAVESRMVPAMTLADICAGGLPSPEIHFLKIDVEGGEQAVLEGADFTRFRPWVVVVEATVPLSRERNDAGWHGLLLEAGYEQAFFDGLNLYFVAHEHRALLPALAMPANVLDDYRPAALHEARQEVARLAGEAERRQAASAGEAAQQHAVLEQQSALLERQEAALATLRAQLAEAQQALHQQRAEAQQAYAALRAQALEGQHGQVVLRAQLAQAEALRQQEHAQAALLQAQLDRLGRILERDAAGAGSLPLAERLEARLHRYAQQVAALGTEVAEARARYDSVLRSTSWRLTGPMRRLVRLGRPEAPQPGAMPLEGGGKELARQVFHRGTKLLLRIPGGRQGARLARSVLPQQAAWLSLRFQAYERRGAEAAAWVAPQPMSLFLPHTAGSEAEGGAYDTSPEEARLCRQITTGGLPALPAR